MAPRPFNVRATLAQAQGMAYRYEGSPAPPVVNQLPSAADFEHEILYVYHYIAASSHPGGKVVPTDLSSTDVAYRVDLTEEPSGVTAYFNLHADTTQADQDFYFGTELADEAELQMRVRQYNNGSNDATYYDAVEWTNITTSGQQHFSLHVDKSAARNSGRAVLEFKFTTHSSTFPNGTRVAILTPIATLYTLQPVNSVATICDEKDNYRFGFNGKEKDNEVKGLGNSLSYEHRIYDSRLGKFLSRDPLFHKYPDMSPYSFSYGSPIYFKDNDGRYIEGANKNLTAGQAHHIFGTNIWINATKATEELGNALIRTETGLKQYEKLQATNYPVALRKDLKDDPDFGKTVFKFKEGTNDVERADMYVNVKNIDKFGQDFSSRYRKKGESDEGFTQWLKSSITDPSLTDGEIQAVTEMYFIQIGQKEAVIGATVGHEIDHTDPKNIVAERQWKNGTRTTKDPKKDKVLYQKEVEGGPEKTETKILNEELTK